MPSTAAPLHYTTRPSSTPDQAQPLLVLLHGYGSNEADLMGLAPYLDPRLNIISVRAPLTLEMGGHAWYNLDLTPEGLRIDMAGAIQARDQLATLVQTLAREWAVEPADIYLLGFSQGAGIGLSTALESPRRLGGIAFLSGLYLKEALPQQPIDRHRDLPVFISHGRHDELIPIDAGRATRDLLSTLPLILDYREYDMGHSIDAECLEDLRTWLQQQLER